MTDKPHLRTLFDNLVTTREEITRWTDSYFTNTAECVKDDGDEIVTYAIFVRHDTVFAPRMAVDWMKEVARKGNFSVEFYSPYEPGDIVPAGQPSLYMVGPMSQLSECETLVLQKYGAPGVAALNAYKCSIELPDAPFIAMGARHCVGTEMQEMMDYAASIGTITAQREGAIGFVNGASHATSHFFGKPKGAGTMPHSFIGYKSSTLEAAKSYRKKHADKPFIVLNDYFGQEVTDAIEVATHFSGEAASGELSFRLDTNGARYLEGLDHEKSIEVIKRHAPELLEADLSEKEEKILYGKGVSVAAVWYFREKLDEAGFENVKIFVSSGFNAEKCRLMNQANAPIDGVGTGSYIPGDFHATYATADIIRYDGRYQVKAAREYLAEEHKNSPNLPQI